MQTTGIPYECFNECESLKNFVITENIEEIGERAFRRCNSLEKIRFPKNIKTIQRGAFMQSVNITEIVFEGSDPNIEYDVEEPIFLEIKAKIYYPADDPTWENSKLMYMNRGNENLTWIPYEITK